MNQFFRLPNLSLIQALVATQLADTPARFLLPSWKVGINQAFEQLAVIRHAKVEEFVHNHNLAEVSIFSEEVRTEVDPPGGRARGPFRCHPLNLNTDRLNADP